VRGRRSRSPKRSTPFSFDFTPTTQIDGVFRLTAESGAVIGGFNYSEERTDAISVWLARKQNGDPKHAYRLLTTDISSLRAAIVRDGLQNGGDYAVPDEGAEFEIAHEAGQEYAVLRMRVPINFEATV
jgi:hypothetical protein